MPLEPLILYLVKKMASGHDTFIESFFLEKLSHLFSRISNNIPSTIKSHFCCLSNDSARIKRLMATAVHKLKIIQLFDLDGALRPRICVSPFLCQHYFDVRRLPVWPLIYRSFVPVSSMKYIFFKLLFK